MTKVANVAKQKLQKWHNIPNVQNKTEDGKPNANNASRTTFSIFGDND